MVNDHMAQEHTVLVAVSVHGGRVVFDSRHVGIFNSSHFRLGLLVLQSLSQWVWSQQIKCIIQVKGCMFYSGGSRNIPKGGF